MTQKDFILIANILTQRRVQIFREGFDTIDKVAIFKTLNSVISDFADTLEAANPKFKRDLFLMASNYTGAN